MGIVASIIATYFYHFVQHMKERNIKIDIEGVWLEHMESDKERPFSIGVIKHDKTRNRYTFDGANYRNDGKPHCTWKTTLFNVDLDSMQI